jgi:transposase-like protein
VGGHEGANRHSSWRMDETAVSVRCGTRYLYRAVDKYGKTVDSLLCVDRSENSARKFFTKALKTHRPRWPTKLNLDGNAASHRALYCTGHPTLLESEHGDVAGST